MISVDDEVHSIVTRYAAINNCSVNEAVRRLVLNANAEEAEASDGLTVSDDAYRWRGRDGLMTPEEAERRAHEWYDNTRPF
jgi:hypothetical protein